jgi:acyl dehydratase
MDYFENRTLGEIRIGNCAALLRTLSKPDVELIAVLSRDVNPNHPDAAFAKSDIFRKEVTHGTCGTGSEVMRCIAAPMVGGMVSATILTLIVIPAIYGLVKEFGIKRRQPARPA